MKISKNIKKTESIINIEEHKYEKSVKKIFLTYCSPLIEELKSKCFDELDLPALMSDLKKRSMYHEIWEGLGEEFTAAFVRERYFRLLQLIYGYSSKEISIHLDVTAKQADKLKETLFRYSNVSEKNLLKLFDDGYYWYSEKVEKFNFDVFRIFERIDEPAINTYNFKNFGIDLNELYGYWPIAVRDHILSCRVLRIKEITEKYLLSPEEAVTEKINVLSFENYHMNIWTDNKFRQDVVVRLKSFGGDFDAPIDYYKIYNTICNDLVKDFDSSKYNLNKLKIIAVLKCCDKKEFIENSPQFLMKKYKIQENDVIEIKNKFIVEKIEAVEKEKEKLENERKDLKGQSIGDFLIEKTELEKEIERRKSLEKQMQNMVRQYAHTLGNTLFPETIYSIAKSLKDHGEFRKESLILRQAYHAEILVRHQAELLRVQHGAGDNFDEFQRLIYQDRLPEDRPDEAVTVRDILNYATERVVARLLNQNDSKLEKSRDQLVSKSGMGLDALRNSFEEQVFFEPQQTALEWVNENVAYTKIGELSPLWKKVRLRKDGYAHALLQGDHWGELLLNSFKYADHTNKEFLTLRFEEHEAENRTWLRMIWENPFLKDEKIESAEVSEKPEDYGKVQKNTVRNFGEGLKGIEANLRQLSATEDENLLLKYGLKNGKFIVTLNYRSDMLVPYQIKNPDLVKNYFQRKREAKEKT